MKKEDNFREKRGENIQIKSNEKRKGQRKNEQRIFRNKAGMEKNENKAEREDREIINRDKRTMRNKNQNRISSNLVRNGYRDVPEDHHDRMRFEGCGNSLG